MANDESGPPPSKRVRQSTTDRPFYGSYQSALAGTDKARPISQSTPSNAVTRDSDTANVRSKPSFPDTMSGGLFIKPKSASDDVNASSGFSFSKDRRQSSLSPLISRRLPDPDEDAYSPTSPPRLNKPIRGQSISAPIYGNTIFTVSVGPTTSPTVFTLHQELASEQSEFIKAALRHGWKESEQKVIQLPDHHPEHFEIFRRWIYCHVIYSADRLEENQSKDNIDDEWDRLAQAWVLGSYLQAPDFRDAVVDAIIDKANNSSGRGECMQRMHEIIYPNTLVGAPIRRLVADIASWKWSPSALFTLCFGTTMSEFFYDLSVAVMRRRDHGDRISSSIQLRDACSYHEHRLNGSPCYRTKQI